MWGGYSSLSDAEERNVNSEMARCDVSPPRVSKQAEETGNVVKLWT